MDEKPNAIDVPHLNVTNRLLLHAVSQTIIPRVGKSNNPTFLEIFYCWRALCSLPLNLPYIILNHMKYVISNKKAELPYGVVLTLIVKRRNVNLSLYVVEEQSIQGSYGSRLLLSMGFHLSKKTWTKDEEGDSEQEDACLKTGKHKAASATK